MRSIAGCIAKSPDGAGDAERETSATYTFVRRCCEQWSVCAQDRAPFSRVMAMNN